MSPDPDRFNAKWLYFSGKMESIHERDRVGVQDCVLLENFRSEKAFVENLRKRFKENLIYVSIQHKNIYFRLSLEEIRS